MLQTHYMKQRPRKRHEDDRGEMLTPLESTVYAAAPEDILFTRVMLIREYARQQRKEIDDYIKTSKVIKEVENVMDDLIAKGYLKEVNGIRLENFIRGL